MRARGRYQKAVCPWRSFCPGRDNPVGRVCARSVSGVVSLVPPRTLTSFCGRAQRTCGKRWAHIHTHTRVSEIQRGLRVTRGRGKSRQRGEGRSRGACVAHGSQQKNVSRRCSRFFGYLCIRFVFVKKNHSKKFVSLLSSCQERSSSHRPSMQAINMSKRINDDTAIESNPSEKRKGLVERLAFGSLAGPDEVVGLANVHSCLAMVAATGLTRRS